MPTQVCHDERVTTHTNPPVPTPAPTCIECHRTFNLLNTLDAQEWFYGHDCETVPTVAYMPTVSYSDGQFEEIILVTGDRIVVTDAFAQKDGSAIVTQGGEFRYVKFRTGDDGVDGYGRRIADLIPEQVQVRRPVEDFFDSLEDGYRGTHNGYDY